MKTIVEQNKSLLGFYERAARLVGGVLLCGGTVWVLIFIFWVLAATEAAGGQWSGSAKNAGHAVSTYVLSFLVPGFLALFIADLARYVLGAEGKPGLLLRYGNWVLYACGAVLAGQALLSGAGWETVGARDPDEAGMLFIGPVLVPLLAKVLLYVALGHILGRVLPIIDESKTLV